MSRTRLRRRLVQALLGLAFTLALGGCEDDFTPATAIESVRLLGMRVEVEGDAARSTPQPGETAEIALALVSPDGRPDPEAGVSTMLVQCTYPERFTGIPICQEFLDQLGADPAQLGALLGAAEMSSEARVVCRPDGTLWGEGTDLRSGQHIEVMLAEDRVEALGVTLICLPGALTTNIQVPEDLDGDVLLRGSLCNKGNAMFDPSLPVLFGCEDSGSAPALPFHTRLRTSGEDGENRNPDGSKVVLEINDLPLPTQAEHDLPREGCADEAEAQDVPLLDPFQHTLRIAVPDSERETLPDGERERFVVGVFATAGEVDRRFVFLDDDSERAEDDGDLLQVTMPWDGPGDLKPSESSLVTFWITLRDERGGFAMLERSICAYLPEAF